MRLRTECALKDFWIDCVSLSDPFIYLANGDLDSVDSWIGLRILPFLDEDDLVGVTVWMLCDSIPRLKFLDAKMRTGWSEAWDKHCFRHPGLAIGVRILKSAVRYMNNPKYKTLVRAILDLNFEEHAILGELLCASGIGHDDVYKWFRDRMPADEIKWMIPSLQIKGFL